MALYMVMDTYIEPKQAGQKCDPQTMLNIYYHKDSLAWALFERENNNHSQSITYTHYSSAACTYLVPTYMYNMSTDLG